MSVRVCVLGWARVCVCEFVCVSMCDVRMYVCVCICKKTHRHTNTHARTHTLTIIHEHMIGVKDVSHVEMCTFVDGEVEEVHSFKGVRT